MEQSESNQVHLKSQLSDNCEKLDHIYLAILVGFLFHRTKENQALYIEEQSCCLNIP